MAAWLKDLGDTQDLINKYYEEEMAIIRAKPLWDQFDGPMRAALRYRAKERAKRRAIQEWEKQRNEAQ